MNTAYGVPSLTVRSLTEGLAARSSLVPPVPVPSSKMVAVPVAALPPRGVAVSV